MTSEKPRILALDLGKRRIGLAISDPLGITAQGLPNLVRTRKRDDLDALERLVKEREVQLILMGNPITMRGSEGRQSGWVREFGESLEKRTGLSVAFWDERLTTVEAGRILRASGIGIAKRAAAIDRLSAVILLQSYLDFGGAWGSKGGSSVEPNNMGPGNQPDGHPGSDGGPRDGGPRGAPRAAREECAPRFGHDRADV